MKPQARLTALHCTISSHSATSYRSFVRNSDYSFAVGYQQIEIKGGGVYSIFCPTFDKTTGQNFTLGDIQVIGQDGKEYDNSDKYHAVSAGKLAVNKLRSGSLKMGTSWGYLSKKVGGVPTRWGDNSTNEFTSGEGVIVYNNLSNLYFRVSGQVVLEPMYIIPGGGTYSIFGNNTPRSMKLSDIGVYGQDGKEYDNSDKYHAVSAGKLAVNKLRNNSLKMGTSWGYLSKKVGGIPTRWGVEGTNTLAAGESVIVYNNMTNLYFRLKSPLSKE